MKLLNTYFKNKEGATTVEFAFVALPLLMGLFACIELSYKLILQSELDSRLYTVVYDISVNNHDAENASMFINNHFCPEIGTVFLKCEDVEIGVTRVTGMTRLVSFRDKQIVGQWDLGSADDALIIELNYPLVDAIHPIAIADVIERNGKKYYRSRGVARREPVLSSGA